MAVMLNACRNTEPSTGDEQVDFFVNPPHSTIRTPIEHYSLDAGSGDTLYSPSGSILIFPKNSMVDSQGKLITGKVDIRFREFNDPVDIFLSGIPMAYDSGGVNFTFESAGMCEILAFQDSLPLFVNPVVQPEILMASGNNQQDFNLYFLDTVQKQWKYQGQDRIIDLNAKSDPLQVPPHSVTDKVPALPLPPLKPEPARTGRPSFTVKIENGSLPELLPYNNFRFEVDDSEKNYNPNDALTNWTDIAVEKTNRFGVYRIQFWNSDRKINILARPVFEGKAYTEALKIFEEKQQEYAALKAGRLDREALLKKERQQELERIEAENRRILENNKEIARLNALTIKRNQELAEALKNQGNPRIRMNLTFDTLRLTEEGINSLRDTSRMSIDDKKQMQKFARQLELQTQIYRSFPINRFGIWNCDQPMLFDGKRLAVRFFDDQMNELDLNECMTSVKNINGIIRCNAGSLFLSRTNYQMVFALKDTILYYLKYEEFENRYRTALSEKNNKIVLHKNIKHLKNSNDIRRILDI